MNLRSITKQHTYLFLLIIAALALVAGCATIVTGSSQSLTINTTPSGATVTLNGNNLGVTPLSVDVKRPETERSVFRFEKAGYKPLELPIDRSMNTWWLGNIITGGVFGSTTDYASGAMYEYQPNLIQVTLEPEQMSSKDKEQFMAENELRFFMLTNFDVLSAQIAAGQGEYLDGLIEKLGISTTERSRVISILKDKLTNAQEAPRFADYVIKHHYNNA